MSTYINTNPNERLTLAISLLRDTRLSRLAIQHKRNPRSVQLYNLYYNKYLIMAYYSFMFLNLCTILLEDPAAIHFNGVAVHYYVPLFINIVCESFFYFRWFHILRVADLQKMKKNKSFWGSLIILILMSIDDVTLIVQHKFEVLHPIRWSRLLRPVLLLTFPENKRIRAAFENIRNTAFDVSSVFAMFIASLLFISVITLKLINVENLSYPNGGPYFANFGEIAWDLYVLSTTANSPDVILPAFEQNKGYFAIYIWVCTACNWLFMGILTASVYNAYKSHLGETVLSTLVKRKHLLDEAFNLLTENEFALGFEQQLSVRTAVETDVDTGNFDPAVADYVRSTEDNRNNLEEGETENENDDDEKRISLELFLKIMKQVEPSRSEASSSLIFNILDIENKQTISSQQFARLTEYLQLNFKEITISRETFLEYIPKFYSIYTTPGFQMYVKIVRSRPVRLFFDLMVLTNGVTLIVGNATLYEKYFEWTFTAIFMIEIILKYIASGGVHFFKDYWNIFDILVVSGAFLGQVLNELMAYYNLDPPGSLTQLFLLLRLFRLLKIVGQVIIFKIIINCIIIILPSLLAYAAILTILFYIFTCIGMEFFIGVFDTPTNFDYTQPNPCGNEKLNGTDFVALHYCTFNFNNAINSFMLLFVLSVGNNWHILVDGFTAVTYKTHRIFFLFVHWLCVLLVLNIVLAFIIEAFLIEYDPQGSKFEAFIEGRLKELKVDAERELETRNFKDFSEKNFFVTYSQLDLAFPPDSQEKPFSAFFFVPDGASIELLMFRMFEDEIEAIARNYKRRVTLRARARDN